MPPGRSLEAVYRERASTNWLHRLRRWLEPPAPYILNSREFKNFPLGRWNLYIGGAGRTVDGYVNLDLFVVLGVDVQADAEWFSFFANFFQCVECDVVLEYVRLFVDVMVEMIRVLAPK